MLAVTAELIGLDPVVVPRFLHEPPEPQLVSVELNVKYWLANTTTPQHPNMEPGLPQAGSRPVWQCPTRHQSQLAVSSTTEAVCNDTEPNTRPHDTQPNTKQGCILPTAYT